MALLVQKLWRKKIVHIRFRLFKDGKKEREKSSFDHQAEGGGEGLKALVDCPL